MRRNQLGRLNNPPQVPLRFNVAWPIPYQPTLREVFQRCSEWGEDLSALSQTPPVGHRDSYDFPSSGRLRVLVRWHATARIRFLSPEHTNVPIPLRVLTGRRRTVAQYADGSFDLLDDRWTDQGSGRRFLERECRGRSAFEVSFENLAPQEQRRFRRAAARSLELLNG